MDADRRVEMRMRFGQGQHIRKVFQIDADAERTADVVLPHPFENPGKMCCQVGEVEVAVGVNQHSPDQRVCVGRVDCMTPPSSPSILRRASCPLSSL